jgi:hypothetical protein
MVVAPTPMGNATRTIVRVVIRASRILTVLTDRGPQAMGQNEVRCDEATTRQALPELSDNTRGAAAGGWTPTLPSGRTIAWCS